MNYHKIKGDFLFDGRTMWGNDKVLIVYEDGTIEAVVAIEDAGEDIDYHSGIICPGFINCHCHLELSHLFKRIPQKTGLVNFILQILSQRNSAENEIISAMYSAEDRMKKNGIVAVGDISNVQHSLSVKAKRQLYYHNFIEVSGFSPLVAKARYEAAVQVYDRFHEVFPNSTTLVPHAPYSVSEQLFELLRQHPNDGIISMHNQECVDENLFFTTGEGSFNQLYSALQVDTTHHQATGLSSLQSVARFFNAQLPYLLVHNTQTSAHDLQWLQLHNLLNNYFFCICINANLYIEDSMPNLNTLLAYSNNMVIGTDSLASNHNLCILSELKTIAQHFPNITTRQLLTWATSNGAKALQIEHQYGSFDARKKPGVNCISNITDDGNITQQSKILSIVA